MWSIYKFGYKINTNCFSWVDTINKIFNIDISADYNKFLNVDNKQKESSWYSCFKEIERHEKISFGNLKIIKLVPRFNRYQSYVYFILLIEGDITTESSNKKLEVDFNLFRNHIKSNVEGFVDNFKIPFKESDFLQDDNEWEKYYEVVYLKNPTLIVRERNENLINKMDKLKMNFGIIYYKYDYNKKHYYDENVDRYMRILNQVYVIEDINKESIKEVLDHFHSIFIIFHRSSSFYSELKCMDAELEMITLISDKLNNIWPKERLSLLLINRFKNMELYNKTFFAVLELNSQLY